MDLKNRLKKLRMDKDASLQFVADSVGASKPHIWELEKGISKNPSLDLLKKLAKFYNVSIDYLAGVNNDLKDQDEELLQFYREIEEQRLDPSDLKILRAAAKAIYEGKNK